MNVDVENLASRMRKELDIRDRSYHLQTYKSCFIGSHAVRWMLRNGLASSISEAEAIGDFLIDHGVFSHVTQGHMFENATLFYRFTQDWSTSSSPSKTPLSVSAVSSIRKLRKALHTP